MTVSNTENVRGLILAGGTGSRLWPLTTVACKQLLPVHDKPMIYYPLTTLMLAGIRDILIITTPKDLEGFKELLGDGSKFGIRLEFRAQDRPRGIADAFNVGADYLAGYRTAFILGDNIFCGKLDFFREAVSETTHACIFGHEVGNPSDFGVAELDDQGRITSLVEKPKEPKSNWAVPGLYVYDDTIVERCHSLKPSARGELEITDLNRTYLDEGCLAFKKIGRGVAWLDAGTPTSLLQASQYVAVVQEQQRLMIACPEEIAYRMGFISADELGELADEIINPDYARYLGKLLQ